MFKQFISIIPGADTFLIFSLVVFMVFFILVGVYLFWMDKKHLDKMEHLPFE